MQFDSSDSDYSASARAIKQDIVAGRRLPGDKLPFAGRLPCLPNQSHRSLSLSGFWREETRSAGGASEHLSRRRDEMMDCRRWQRRTSTVVSSMREMGFGKEDSVMTRVLRFLRRKISARSSRKQASWMSLEQGIYALLENRSGKTTWMKITGLTKPSGGDFEDGPINWMSRSKTSHGPQSPIFYSWIPGEDVGNIIRLLMIFDYLQLLGKMESKHTTA